MTGRPLPVPDELSAPYWEACARHELVLPQCTGCGGTFFPPALVCPLCHAPEATVQFAPVGGNGQIRTWTVVRQAFLPGFDVPYVLVDVQLDEAPAVRLIGMLLDGPEAALAIGMPVAVAFEDLADGVSVPAFRLSARS